MALHDPISFEVKKVDEKYYFIEETDRVLLPSGTATARASTGTKKEPENIEVMPDLKSKYCEDAEMKEDSDQKDENNKDPIDFDVKGEINKSYSGSEGSDSDDMFLETYIDHQYKKITVKSYTSKYVTKDPIKNLKEIFKESTIEFETIRWHQDICERVIQSLNKTSLKNLQEEYMAQLREVASVEIFTCNLCKYQTMNLSNLKCHLLVIHNGKMECDIFQCKICKYEANFTSHIKNHMAKHNKVAKRRSIKERRVNKRSRALRQTRTVRKPMSSEDSDQNSGPMDDTHSISNSESDVADKKPTKRYKKRSQSLKNAKNAERFPCQQCSYIGRSDEKLKNHQAVHKDRSNCDLCTFRSNDNKILQTHKDTHKEGKKFLCYLCSYTITNKATLGRHLLNVHKIANEASKRSKMCEICSFSCSSRNQLQIHYLTHKTVSDLAEEEIFRCPEPGCNHQTKLKCHLRVHMKTHKAPDFVCEICGFATRRRESYRNHLITHKRISEIEWLRCTVCPYQARNKKLLRRHMRNGDHSGKLLRHIRNRDRKREAEESGGQINSESQMVQLDIKDVKVKKIRRRRKKKDLIAENNMLVDTEIMDDIKDPRMSLLASLSDIT